jgi:hypothetical protein
MKGKGVTKVLSIPELINASANSLILILIIAPSNTVPSRLGLGTVWLASKKSVICLSS